MSIVDESENDIFSVLGKLVAASRDVIRFDGTDRLSIEQLREAVDNYNTWLSSEA
jgi:hypothetical protein